MIQKTVAISMGDPLGIGPEIIVKAMAKMRVRGCHFVIAGFRPVFESLPLFRKIKSKSNITFIDVASPRVIQPNPAECGRLTWESLDTCVALLKKRKAHALVTAPISKAHMKEAGFRFAGHTEYLCHAFKVKKYAMMLFHDRLRVVLTTIHCPLKRVARQITKEAIEEKLIVTAQGLENLFKIKHPKIAVCGLNPHAGEDGVLGDEEQSIIKPAIAAFNKKKSFRHVSVTGPHPADTVFLKALNGDYDAVLCQYHDQGLIPLKTTGFHGGVNLTLGLPIVRTSPDHGTAFDIAGQGVANQTSMVAALKSALDFM